LQDCLFDGSKHQSNVGRISRLRETWNRREPYRSEANEANVSALWIDAQARAIGLHEPPQYVFGGFIDVVTARVFGEVFLQWHLFPTINGRNENCSTVALTLGNLILKTSILFKKRIIDVRKNHREFITDSKRIRLSIIRFCRSLE
jgi:hypothetical protein